MLLNVSLGGMKGNSARNEGVKSHTEGTSPHSFATGEKFNPARKCLQHRELSGPDAFGKTTSGFPQNIPSGFPFYHYLNFPTMIRPLLFLTLLFVSCGKVPETSVSQPDSPLFDFALLEGKATIRDSSQLNQLKDTMLQKQLTISRVPVWGKYIDLPYDYLRLTPLDKALEILTENPNSYDYKVGIAGVVTDVEIAGYSFRVYPTDQELLELTRHEVPSVRYYAYLALQHRQSKNLKQAKSILANDQGIIDYFSGCSKMQYTISQLVLN